MATAGRRKFERYKTKIPVNIVAKSGWISAVARDISEAGVRFKSHTFIPPDTHVSIRFQGQKESAFTGWVVWATAVHNTDGLCYHIGVEFKAIIFSADNIMEMPSKDEMVRKVIAEIKKLGGTVRKQ